MKKLFFLLFATLLLSCSKNEEILQVESEDELSEASILKKAFGSANVEYAIKKTGQYKVATNAVRRDCNQLFGRVQRVLSRAKIINPSMRCSGNFPTGFDERLSTEVFYPENIAKLEKLPVISFVGGVLSDKGNYDDLVRLWASYGFIVINSSNFINFSPEVHVFGLSELVIQNNDPTSALYQKVDFSKTLISGHSAGGAATIQVSKMDSNTLAEIDPNLKIIGSFPLEATLTANGQGVNVPTLILTGYLDLLVPAGSWPLIDQYQKITNVPAWYSCARFATHFSPTLANVRNEFAGISVAFILYIAKNDKNASKYFIGSKYELSKDKQFVQDKSLAQKLRRLATGRDVKVQRNSLAAKL